MKLQELFEYKSYAHTGQGYPYAAYRGKPHLHNIDPDFGPHEGRELSMLLDKVKPAALVHDRDYKHFKPYVDKGELIAKKFDGRGFTEDDKLINYIVALPGESARVERLVKLFSMSREDVMKMGLELYSAKVGRLLGYTKEQVRKFIQQKIRRES